MGMSLLKPGNGQVERKRRRSESSAGVGNMPADGVYGVGVGKLALRRFAPSRTRGMSLFADTLTESRRLRRQVEGEAHERVAVEEH